MPQFILQGKESPKFQELDDFTQGYIEAMFFTESGPDYEEDGMNEIGFIDLASESIEQIIKDCNDFQRNNESLLDAAIEVSAGEYEMDQAGRDFWFTRNYHGVGYWDRGLKGAGEGLTDSCRTYEECYMYRGDDGKVYVQ